MKSSIFPFVLLAAFVLASCGGQQSQQGAYHVDIGKQLEPQVVVDVGIGTVGHNAVGHHDAQCIHHREEPEVEQQWLGKGSEEVCY